MDAKQAISVLNILISGIDPHTGELIQKDHFVRRDAVQSALRSAVQALRENPPQQPVEAQPGAGNRAVRRHGRGRRYGSMAEPAAVPEQRAVFSRSGMPWEPDEDQMLARMARSRMPVSDMALELKRTPYAVFCRLERKNLYGKECGYPAREERGAWSHDELDTLFRMAGEGKGPLEIADALNRSFYNVRKRVEYLALSHRMLEEGGEVEP